MDSSNCVKINYREAYATDYNDWRHSSNLCCRRLLFVVYLFSDRETGKLMSLEGTAKASDDTENTLGGYAGVFESIASSFSFQ